MEREDNYIAGLSMGGGGAMRIGLLNPDKYSRICMLSTGGVAPLEQLWREIPADPKEYDVSPGYRRLRDIYGFGDTQKLEGTDHDIIKLIKDTALRGEKLPKVYHAMGTEDIRYPVAMKIKETFEGLPGNPYDYEYHEGPGTHEWAFWDRWILEFLRTLPQGMNNGLIK
jgi:putative tributyrin esterase